MILVTSGCSFSADNFTWPAHLSEYLNAHHHPMGWASSGNGFISRRAIYKVTELLNAGADPNDILVGIMWSGPDRIELYTQNPIVYDNMSIPRTSATGICVWPETDDTGKWLIMNAGFESQLAKNYYKVFHNETQSMMHTYEHILRTQWFLEKFKIRYFMTTYTSEVLQEDVNTVQVNHLKNLLNRETFLPIDGCYEWLVKNSKYKFSIPNDNHPSGKQHKEFVKQVIVPFLIERKLIAGRNPNSRPSL